MCSFSEAKQYYNEARRDGEIRRDQKSRLTSVIVGPSLIFIKMSIPSKIGAWWKCMSEVSVGPVKGRVVVVICQKQNSRNVPLSSHLGQPRRESIGFGERPTDFHQI